MMEELLKMKNFKKIERIKTPIGSVKIYITELHSGEKRLAIISSPKQYFKRYREKRLFNEIHKFNKEAPRVIGFGRYKKALCLILEWKECDFMKKIVSYYKIYN